LSLQIRFEKNYKYQVSGGEYEKCRLLVYKHPVSTSQETHYFFATEPTRLMLCKIWDFHGGDYEECRLLEYKNPGRTSQETHYDSVTESGRLMLCKVWDFHGGDWRMPSSGLWHRVTLVRTDVSEKRIS
jgi:hypothetical protein